MFVELEVFGIDSVKAAPPCDGLDVQVVDQLLLFTGWFSSKKDTVHAGRIRGIEVSDPGKLSFEYRKFLWLRRHGGPSRASPFGGIEPHVLGVRSNPEVLHAHWREVRHHDVAQYQRLQCMARRVADLCPEPFRLGRGLGFE